MKKQVNTNDRREHYDKFLMMMIKIKINKKISIKKKSNNK